MSGTQANAPATARPKRHKGPRPKHVPQRTCVACRETGTKRAGRGAYLCARQRCWERGVNERVLGRALRLEQLTAENREALLRYADERVPDEPDDMP